ncbi:MAG: cofactor-independent phosphoglycerate mutase [Candidatus Omnitrophica bacterium]|nr:cofactor-independent phosphoglycerate mutase [Candidatus Omnitrophota bacterium]
MKYAVLVADGMADYPLKELDNRTPLEVARTPNMDFLAKHGRIGRVSTIPKDMSPASDVANISILGYDPKVYYTGRGPLEAANLGVKLKEGEVAFRCNLITAGDDALVDYSAGHIGSKEAAILIKAIDKALGSSEVRFYPGVSYRHLMVVSGSAAEGMSEVSAVAPHDIMGKKISRNFPKGSGADFLIKLMNDSRRVLSEHEINSVRIDLKENPANMIWLWGQGKKPAMPSFKERFGISGSIISAVDLIKGLGRILGLSVINVEGATGYYDTNYEGKARAACSSLQKSDLVFLHVEAPDEAGHNADLREKMLAIERFDKSIVGALLEMFEKQKDMRILVLPDHATPISLRTHTNDPVCFVIFGKDIIGEGALGFSEKSAENSALIFENGHELLPFFLKGV